MLLQEINCTAPSHPSSPSLVLDTTIHPKKSGEKRGTEGPHVQLLLGEQFIFRGQQQWQDDRLTQQREDLLCREAAGLVPTASEGCSSHQPYPWDASPDVPATRLPAVGCTACILR